MVAGICQRAVHALVHVCFHGPAHLSLVVSQLVKLQIGRQALLRDQSFQSR